MKTLFSLVRRRSALTKKIARHIEIVSTSNPRLNAMARGSQLSIQAALSERYTSVGITIVDDMAGLERLVAKRPDLVVLGTKLVLLEPAKGYDASPKLWLSSYLQQQGIAFTGSTTPALMLEFDKQNAKQVVLAAGLQSSPYFIATIGMPTFAHMLNFPLFVKPADRGGSRGVDEQSVVYSQVELEQKVRSIHVDFASDALVEEYLPGREFSVAVISQQSSGQLLAMPVEIAAPADSKGNSFLSKSVKEADSEQVLAVQDPILKQAINALAIGVFEALGARDYGRIDMRLDAAGNPSFIEANLMPGLSNHGYLSRCFHLNESISHSTMIRSIVALGLTRTTVSLPEPLLTNLVQKVNPIVEPAV